MSKKMRKMLVMISAMSLVAIIAVGGTMAWLTASTESVVNTFTPAGVTIDLFETITDEGTTVEEFKTGKWDAQLIPDKAYPKNPQVEVEKSDVDLWVFVKIDEEHGFTDGTKVYEYNVNDAWKKVDGTDNVYYVEYDMDADPAVNSWYVLAGEGEGTMQNGMVTITDDITIENMSTAEGAKLTLTAYAVQKEAATTAAAAWALLTPTNTTTNP